MDGASVAPAGTGAMSEAYLDIETTSLEPHDGELTVVGFYIEGSGRLVQLIEDDLRAANLLQHLAGCLTLYTFNGQRFDLPYINAKLGLDLARRFSHVDLMHACHRQNLYGGMKKVERMLGIPRLLTEVNGMAAVRLWQRWKLTGCRKSLAVLLEYNREDVMNLRALRHRLGV